MVRRAAKGATREHLAERLKESDRRLRESQGLWRFWRDTDITEDDDLWASFTNAVYAHLEGKPVPKKFLK